MRHRALRLSKPAAVLALALWFLTLPSDAADAPAQVLPDADYPKMVKYAVKGIQDALKGKAADTQVTKARTAAVMIAAYAQQNLSGADGQQRATVRDAALKIGELIDQKKFAEAIKAAEGLSSLKPDPMAKTERVAILDKQVKFENLMKQFDRPKEGGWGIYSQFYNYQLGMKGKIPANDLNDQLLMMAYQVAVTADMVNSKTPDKNPKDWDTFSAALRKGALDLAGAVKAKDGQAGIEAVAKITHCCTNCHKEFRDKQ